MSDQAVSGATQIESPLITGDRPNNSANMVQSSNYRAHVGLTLVFALFAGYKAAVQPEGAGWRFFSYHPFLMVFGFVGMMGASALTKKLGGYTNTKLHGILASSGLMMVRTDTNHTDTYTDVNDGVHECTTHVGQYTEETRGVHVPVQSFVSHIFHFISPHKLLYQFFHSLRLLVVYMLSTRTRNSWEKSILLLLMLSLEL